jgi:hypothetical protein
LTCASVWASKPSSAIGAEHPHHDVLQAPGRRDGGHAQVHVERPEAPELDLAVLRLAPLGDVELAHHLDARDHRLAESRREVEVRHQRAVLAESDAHVAAGGIRLDVDVRSLLLDRVDDHLVDELHERAVVCGELLLVEVGVRDVGGKPVGDLADAAHVGGPARSGGDAAAQRRAVRALERRANVVA